MHRLHKFPVHLAVAIITGICAFCANAAASSNDDSRCSGWELTDRSPPLDFRLKCASELVEAGSVDTVPEATLITESGFYYQEAARTGDRRNAEFVRLLDEARERRKSRIWAHSDSYYTALLMVGDIEGAIRERQRKNLRVPRLEFAATSVPTVGTQGHPVYWSFNAAGKLEPSAVRLDEGARIVVYTSPGCGRCQAASKELSGDPALLQDFRDHSIWINVPDANLDRNYYADWDVIHPDFPVHAILSRVGWPEWKVPGTPYFFFMRDGRVVSEMLGWTGTSKRELEVHLRGIGLEPMLPADNFPSGQAESKR